MTDAEDLAYFTDVLKRLDALTNRQTDDGVLLVMATEAKSYVGTLVGALVSGSEDAIRRPAPAIKTAIMTVAEQYYYLAGGEFESPGAANARQKHGADMWELKFTNAAKEWSDAGTYETVAGAAGRIIELEEYPVHGVFLEFHVLAGSIPDSDEKALRVFHHTGKRALYCIRRARAN